MLKRNRLDLIPDWQDQDCSGKRTRCEKQVSLPTLRHLHSAFRLYSLSRPNEHDFNALLEGSLRCYHVAALQQATTLVFVKFDDQLFSDAPDRAQELVTVDVFDEFTKLYKTTQQPVPLHGVAFRGHDLRVPYQWLVTKVVDGRSTPGTLIWEAASAGLELPLDTQLRWAIHCGVGSGGGVSAMSF